MACVDLLVHRTALMGSPAVVSSKIRVNSACSFPSPSSTRLRPAPASRILPSVNCTNFLLLHNSATALVIVVRDIPVNLERRLIPPRPWSRALSATNNRAWNSFNVFSNLSQRLSSGERRLDLLIHPTVTESRRFVQIIHPARLKEIAEGRSRKNHPSVRRHRVEWVD